MILLDSHNSFSYELINKDEGIKLKNNIKILAILFLLKGFQLIAGDFALDTTSWDRNDYGIFDSDLKKIIQKNQIYNPLNNVLVFIENLVSRGGKYRSYEYHLIESAKKIACEHFAIKEDLDLIITGYSMSKVFEILAEVEGFVNFHSFDKPAQFKSDHIKKAQEAAYKHFKYIAHSEKYIFELDEEGLNEKLLSLVTEQNPTRDNQVHAALCVIAGANANLQDVDGTPILALAIDKKFEKIVHILVFYGANVNFGNYEYVPLWHAFLENDKNSIRVLLEHGAKIDVAIEDGITPLMQAVYNQSAEMVELLLIYNPDLVKENADGQTALEVAIELKETKIAKLIRAKNYQGCCWCVLF